MAKSIPDTLGRMSFGPRWVSCMQMTAHWCLLLRSATSCCFAADWPSTLNDLTMRAGPEKILIDDQHNTMQTHSFQTRCDIQERKQHKSNYTLTSFRHHAVRHLMVNMITSGRRPNRSNGKCHIVIWWRDHFSSFTSILSGLHLEIR